MTSSSGPRRIGANLPRRRRRLGATAARWFSRRLRRLRRWWARRPRWQQAVILGGASLTTLAILATVWLGVTTFRDLRAARDKLDESATAVLDRRVDDATELLDGAADDLARARDRAGSFPASLIAEVPLLGSPFRAAESAADAGTLVIEGSRLLVEASDRFPTEGVAGVDGNDLSALHDASLDTAESILQARVQFEEARRQMSGPAGAMLGWVSGPSRRMIEVIDDGLVRLDNAERALQLAAELTGEEADHRVLVVAMNSLEIRPVGGYFGSFGVLRFDRGTVELERYDSFESLPNPEPPLPTPEFLDSALPNTRYGLENAGWWPEFPRAAEDAAVLFERQGGGEITAVVAISEDLVGQLLSVFGPISVPGYTEPVSADTFEARVLYETLTKRPLDTPRKKFTIELSKIVFDKLLNLPADQVPAVGTVFADAAGRGELLAWFPDPDLQSLVVGTLVAGEFPDTDGDFLAITDANLSASKANKDVTKAVSYRVQRRSDGRLEARLTIIYTNSGEYEPSVNPYYNAFVQVYVPAGAELIDDIDDESLALDATDEEVQSGSGVIQDAGDFIDGGIDPETGFSVFRRSVLVEPGERRQTVLQYVLPEQVSASSYHLTWLRQPGTADDELRVLIGGRTERIATGQRAFELQADLSGNAVMDWLRRRWVIDRLLN